MKEVSRFFIFLRLTAQFTFEVTLQKFKIIFHTPVRTIFYLKIPSQKNKNKIKNKKLKSFEIAPFPPI
jgi:hypothetical protein